LCEHVQFVRTASVIALGVIRDDGCVQVVHLIQREMELRRQVAIIVKPKLSEIVPQLKVPASR
jgi:hypothetical protein